MWPEFDAHDLRAALRDFRRRDRRFGSLPPNRHQIMITTATNVGSGNEKSGMLPPCPEPLLRESLSEPRS